MSSTLQQQIGLHNARVELEALRAEGRAMVWTNEMLVHRKQEPEFIEDHFNALAARIRETKVKIDDGVMLAQIR